MMTTQKQIRAAFWAEFPQLKRTPGWTQNQYNATIRSTFVEFVDMLHRNEEISEKLAFRATL
jgi:hypothetical protein